MHCFDGMHAIIFVASLSCYDEEFMDEENQTKNRMVNSLEQFREICNSQCFQAMRPMLIILFLNKCELFWEKPKTIPFTKYFPEYEGNPNDSEEILRYIKHRFIACNENEDRNIYIHITTAVDARNVERVFNDVRHIVVPGCYGGFSGDVVPHF